MLSRRSFAAALASLVATSAGSGSARAQGTRTPVRVGFVPVIGASALYVLDKAGWAADAGLAIVTTKFDSGPAAISALASGTLDVLAIGVAPVAVAYAKGIDVKVVSAAGIGGSMFVAGDPLAKAFAAQRDPAKAFAAFRADQGRKPKIATLPPGAVPTTAFKYWLKQHAVVTDDLEIVTMGIEAAQQAMLAGAVDGGQVLEPAATIVQSRDPRFKPIVTAPQMFPDIPGVVLAATGAFARSHADALDTLLRLAIRATDLIRARPGEAAPYVQQALGGGLVEVGVMARALASPAISFLIDPRAIVPTTRHMLAFQAELGDFPKAPETDGLFDFAPYDRAAAGK
ncbi:ABC transporter substrate-binding protein [Chelatococcus reniformis]|uniref:Nitrate ABC transporter substrate-binding protein n=1 Tax=Chelatococcus reniformis TaxID=1494448 RepID=A0A916U0C9_9HYPH|nr:ABC transporter substrate-binding protein [Chelatococcus reniformis]GGC54273.1 hypothetical protein GCM10010994_11560 [Chelatococcus reniformis]